MTLNRGRSFTTRGAYLKDPRELFIVCSPAASSALRLGSAAGPAGRLPTATQGPSRFWPLGEAPRAHRAEDRRQHPCKHSPGELQGKTSLPCLPWGHNLCSGRCEPCEPSISAGTPAEHPLRWAHRSPVSRKALGHPGPGARCDSGVRRSTGCSCTGATAGRHGGSQAHTWRLGLTRACQAARTVLQSSPGGGTGDRFSSGNRSSRLQLQMVRCLGRSRRCLARLWVVLRGTERLPNPSPLLLPSPPLPKPVPCTFFCPEIAPWLQVHRESGQQGVAGTALPADRSGCLRLWAPRPDPAAWSLLQHAEMAHRTVPVAVPMSVCALGSWYPAQIPLPCRAATRHDAGLPTFPPASVAEPHMPCAGLPSTGAPCALPAGSHFSPAPKLGQLGYSRLRAQQNPRRRRVPPAAPRSSPPHCRQTLPTAAPL